MKVVHVITSLGVGGAERMLARLIAARPPSVESHVICLAGEGPVAEEMRSAGATVYALGMERHVFRSAHLFTRMVGLLRDLRPDVVQTWLYHADLLGGLAARLVGIDAVLWNIRSVEIPDTTSVLTRVVMRVCSLLSARLPTRIVCCSETARLVHEQRGYCGRRFVIIPNGFDMERFKPDRDARREIRQELQLPQNAVLIGLVARLDPLKNHALFFSAAKKLHETNPEVHFMLVGKDVHERSPTVHRWMSEAGVTDVVRLLGQRRDIERLTAALDIATCCSTSEAFPNSLGEAMSCAVPCVTTAVGDAAMIVGNTGYVVPSGDAEALASAWRSMLALPEAERHRLGEAARNRVRFLFEISAVARQYVKLYESLIGGPARG